MYFLCQELPMTDMWSITAISGITKRAVMGEHDA